MDAVGSNRSGRIAMPTLVRVRKSSSSSSTAIVEPVRLRPACLGNDPARVLGRVRGRGGSTTRQRGEAEDVQLLAVGHPDHAVARHKVTALDGGAPCRVQHRSIGALDVDVAALGARGERHAKHEGPDEHRPRRQREDGRHDRQ